MGDRQIEDIIENIFDVATKNILRIFDRELRVLVDQQGVAITINSYARVYKESGFAATAIQVSFSVNEVSKFIRFEEEAIMRFGDEDKENRRQILAEIIRRLGLR